MDIDKKLSTTITKFPFKHVGSQFLMQKFRDKLARYGSHFSSRTLVHHRQFWNYSEIAFLIEIVHRDLK